MTTPSRTEGWWKTSVVYQVYPRSFADSNADGIGDLPGITARLDYLQQLGVDVLWLSPVYASPMDDNGYDISDYQDVDPVFGTLGDLDHLIAELHARDMKLVMDLVVNHTSDEHPWFQESRDPTSPKRDWYWWRPANDGREPNNWGSIFGGPAWELDEASGEYYLHMFSRKQPDLNWENPEVRQAVYAMMRWWVDRGVDGFRMDVINLISKPVELTDGYVFPGQSLAMCAIPVMNGPRLHEFLSEMNAAVGLTERHLLTVGEMPGVNVDMARALTHPSHRQLDMVFTFEHVMLDLHPSGDRFALQPVSLPALKQNFATWQLGLAECGWNSLYWDNHDQPRAVSRFGDDSPEMRVASAKTLATVLHLHRGTPYVYQGEELGMTNAGLSDISQYQDIEALNNYAEAMSEGRSPAEVMPGLMAKSRDNARTPMQWDASPHAGFTAGTPWLPATANYLEINAEAAVGDPDSVFHHYRQLIELRRTHAIVVEGVFELLLEDHEQIWSFVRHLEGQLLVVIANCSSTAALLPPEGLLDLSAARVILSTHGTRGATELRPWESLVYLLS